MQEYEDGTLSQTSFLNIVLNFDISFYSNLIVIAEVWDSQKIFLVCRFE